jgi:hypothetical protein
VGPQRDCDLGLCCFVVKVARWIVVARGIGVVVGRVCGLRQIGTCLAMEELVMNLMKLSFWNLGLCCMEPTPFFSFKERERESVCVYGFVVKN